MNESFEREIDISAPSEPAYLVLEPERLQVATLENLAKEFVLREIGQEYSAAADMDQVIKSAVLRLYSRELLITFDPSNESVGVITRERLIKDGMSHLLG